LLLQLLDFFHFPVVLLVAARVAITVHISAPRFLLLTSLALLNLDLKLFRVICRFRVHFLLLNLLQKLGCWLLNHFLNVHLFLRLSVVFYQGTHAESRNFQHRNRKWFLSRLLYLVYYWLQRLYLSQGILLNLIFNVHLLLRLSIVFYQRTHSQPAYFQWWNERRFLDCRCWGLNILLIGISYGGEKLFTPNDARGWGVSRATVVGRIHFFFFFKAILTRNRALLWDAILLLDAKLDEGLPSLLQLVFKSNLLQQKRANFELIKLPLGVVSPLPRNREQTSNVSLAQIKTSFVWLLVKVLVVEFNKWDIVRPYVEQHQLFSEDILRKLKWQSKDPLHES
jgi:hypothetical protein